MPQSPTIPAATLIVMRDRSDGPPELLMVERASAMAFAGGALVFPGGRVDPGDHALVPRFAGDRDDIAARIAAIRETLEEAGLAIGLTPQLNAAALRTLASAVYGGEPIEDALAAAAITIDPAVLTPFARWLPPGDVTHKIFDTRFYLAEAPADAPAARVDGNENVRLLWASATEILADADAGRATILYPTRRNLERLAGFASFADALADARAHPVETISPWIEERGGERYLCIPGHLGYPVTAELLARTLRA